MGAGEAGGARRGQYKQQATGHMPEPASTEHEGSHQAKSPVNTPPLAQGFTDKMKQNQRNEKKPEIFLPVPNPTQSKSEENPKKIQLYSITPNTQSETKEIRSPASDPI